MVWEYCVYLGLLTSSMGLICYGYLPSSVLMRLFKIPSRLDSLHLSDRTGAAPDRLMM